MITTAMRKILNLLLMAAFACVLCSSTPKDILSFKEYRVMYKTVINGNTYKSENIFTSEYFELTFRGDERSQITNEYNFIENKLITQFSDENGKVSFLEMDLMGPSDTNDQSSPKLKVNKDTKEINGVECKHITAVFDNDEEMEIWYFTPQHIDTRKLEMYNIYEGIPGIIMKASKQDNVVLEAIHIDSKARDEVVIPDSVLQNVSIF